MLLIAALYFFIPVQSEATPRISGYIIEFLYPSAKTLIEKYPPLSVEQKKCIITYQDNLYLKRVGLRQRIKFLNDRCKAVVGKFKSLVNAGSNKSSGEIYITSRNGKRFSGKGYIKFPNQIMFTEMDVTGIVSNTDSTETISIRFHQKERFDIIEDINLCNAPDNSAFPAYSEKAVEFNASFTKKEGNILMYEAVLIHPETEKPIGRILLEPMSQ